MTAVSGVMGDTSILHAAIINLIAATTTIVTVIIIAVTVLLRRHPGFILGTASFWVGAKDLKFLSMMRKPYLPYIRIMATSLSSLAAPLSNEFQGPNHMIFSTPCVLLRHLT